MTLGEGECGELTGAAMGASGGAVVERGEESACVIGPLRCGERAKRATEQIAEQLDESLLLCGSELNPELLGLDGDGVPRNQRGGTERRLELDMVHRRVDPSDVVGTNVPAPVTPLR